MKQAVINFSRRILPEKVKKMIFHYAFNIAQEEYRYFAYKYSKLPDLEYALIDLKKRGLEIRNIVDVGAYEGAWGRLVRGIWPSANITMVEANNEKRALLSQVAGEINATIEFALLGAENGAQVEYHIMETGSSVYEENSTLARVSEQRQTTQLDLILDQDESVDLLKIDTQGYELEVLKGATKTLNRAKAVILEVSLIQINKGAPLIHEVLNFMFEQGFVSYEIVEIHRRLKDGAMNQLDILFVRHDSELLSSLSFD